MNKKIAAIIQTSVLVMFMQGCLAEEITQDKLAGNKIEPANKVDQVDPVPSSNLISRWVGTYESEVRACRTERLVIDESKFSWGESCKDGYISVISVSDNTLVFKINPKSECGRAGWIVALDMPDPSSKTATLTAYETIDDYESKRRVTYCTYSRI